MKALKKMESGKVLKFIEPNKFRSHLCKKNRHKAETKINWNISDANKVISHIIHGLSPSPGAWFQYEK